MFTLVLLFASIKFSEATVIIKSGATSGRNKNTCNYMYKRLHKLVRNRRNQQVLCYEVNSSNHSRESP